MRIEAPPSPIDSKSIKIFSGSEKKYSDRNIPQQCIFGMVGFGGMLFSFYSLAFKNFFSNSCYLHNKKKRRGHEKCACRPTLIEK